MTDHLELFGESLIQHGKNNNRVYLMKVSLNDCQKLIDYAIKLSETNGYSKIFAKVKKSCSPLFLKNGFTEEAKVTYDLEDSENWRFANSASISVAINARFSLKVSHVLSYLNEPVVGFEKTDTTTSAALVAKF